MQINIIYNYTNKVILKLIKYLKWKKINIKIVNSITDINDNYILFNYLKTFKSPYYYTTLNKYNTNIKLLIKEDNIRYIVYNFLKDININNKTIYLSRHGESIYNTKKFIGGDSDLSINGIKYSNKIYYHFKNKKDLIIITSELKRTINTVQLLKQDKYKYKELNEINAGIFDSMTYKEIEESNPIEFQNRKKDKLNYRYPDGESYIDLINRLDNIIVKLESLDYQNILIIGHQAIIRVLMSYFKNLEYHDILNLDIKLHNLYILKDEEEDYTINELLLLK